METIFTNLNIHKIDVNSSDYSYINPIIMRTLLLELLILVLIPVLCSSQSNVSLKERVQKAHQSFINGILAEDYKLVDELLANDVTLGFPDGDFSPKQDYVAALKSGTLFYDSSANQSFNTRIYGNTGVVNGKGDLIFRYRDEKGDWFRMLEHLSFTAVYVMENKKVKMVAWQSNRPLTDRVEKISK
ncbi:nuclear transport factor 2 family protein [Flavihumibacter sediminis]|nr:nuclear transport factor 2 family protein [Flavihumibacter sediminis]